MNKIKKCSCNGNRRFPCIGNSNDFLCLIYTLKGECPDCGAKTSSAHPVKFSPEDKYGKYRRISQQSNGNP